MYRKTLGALAICAIALGAVGVATPADARSAHLGVFIEPTFGPPDGPRECWQWSHRIHDWVWTCRRLSERDYVPYADNGLTFGFSFGGGGFGDRNFGDRNRRHDH
jgi:hypothetical protein